MNTNYYKPLTIIEDKAIRQGIPVMGQFELTPVCNLQCKMCYVHEPALDLKRNLKPVSFWIEMAKVATAHGMLVLSLSGGETLLYKDLDQLMEAIRNLGLMISFNTNGILIDEKRANWFAEYCPNKINISLYGASNRTYEKLCGCRDGFTRVANAIDLLLERNLNVYLNTVLTPDNISELPQMHQFATERGLILHSTTYTFPKRKNKQECKTYRFSSKAAANAYCYDQLILNGEKKFKQKAATTVMGIEKFQKMHMMGHPSECKGGKCNFQVTWDGKLQTCALFSGIQLDVTPDNFEKCWNELKKQIDLLESPEKCKSCAKQLLCPVCKAAVYLETGTHTMAPEYLCSYSETLEMILREECASERISLQHSGNLNSHHCEF